MPRLESNKIFLPDPWESIKQKIYQLILQASSGHMTKLVKCRSYASPERPQTSSGAFPSTCLSICRSLTIANVTSCIKLNGNQRFFSRDRWKMASYRFKYTEANLLSDDWRLSRITGKGNIYVSKLIGWLQSADKGSAWSIVGCTAAVPINQIAT